MFRPWEFNSTFPLRSVVLPYLTSGPPLVILRLMQEWFGIKALSTQAVLVLPRLVFTVISGFTDILVYKIAGTPALLFFATSYVNMVYYTRTLSNSMEAFLFVGLLYLVISDKNAQETRVGQKAMRALTNQGKTLSRESRGRHKSRKLGGPPVTDMSKDTECEVHTPFSDVVMISLVLVAGTFNRPTFLIFALVPYVWWIFSTCGSSDHHIATHTIDRITFSVIISGAISLMFVVVDSIYYGSLSPFDLLGMHRKLLDSNQVAQLLKSLSVTPLNFILYNIKPDNLAEHGLHPRFQHLLINTPTLFGMFAAFPLYQVGKILEAKLGVNSRSRWSAINKTHKLLLMCYFIPVIMLSVFPHQEPRFLIPLLGPLAMIYGSKLFGYTAWRPWSVLWVLFNIIAAFFFGILHQGGIIPCIEYVQSTLVKPPASPTETHITFFHTYMPPRHLFLIAKAENADKQNTFVHDLKGASFDSMIQHIDTLNARYENASRKMLHYIVAPSTLDELFCKKYKNVSFKMKELFSLHLSMEDPPSLPNDFTCKDAKVISCNRKCSKRSVWERVEDAFSLFMYKVNVET